MVMRAATASAFEKLRPLREVFARAVLTWLLLTVPVLAVTYWLTIPAGGWQIVLGVHISVLILAIAAMRAFFSTGIRLGTNEVYERGFFGRVSRVSADQVASAEIVELYQSGTAETRPNLFIAGHDGELLLRMRGEFWLATDMVRVAERLNVQVSHAPNPVTLTQLRTSSPELLYWFERFPSWHLRLWR